VRGYGSSWLDELMAVCFGLLAAAVALYLTVRLIEAIWLVLLVIAACVGTVVGVVAWLRWDRAGW
jgi:putative effector of murein hydrolase